MKKTIHNQSPDDDMSVLQEDPGDAKYNKQFNDFKQNMPDKFTSINVNIVERAFRKLYNAVENRQEFIIISDVADEIMGSLKDSNIYAMGAYHEKLVELLDAIMCHFAELFKYRKEGLEDLSQEMGRVIWPYVATLPDARAVIASITDAVLSYVNACCEFCTLDAADFVMEKCPGILTMNAMNLLMVELFDLMSEAGHIHRA